MKNILNCFSGLKLSKTVLVISNKKQRFDEIKRILPSDFPVSYAYPARTVDAEMQLDFILLPCDFNCSLANCFAQFKFMLLHLDIPFAIFRFLPVGKKRFPKPPFSLSFFESLGFSPDQMEVIDRLRSSESYSRCLISRLPPRRFVSKVLAIQTEITENPMEIFSLERLSRMAGLSPGWLSRGFREMSGITLRSFLVKNKLCLALWRLTSSEKLIKTIAIELGYHPLSFSERFREVFGVPPRTILAAKKPI